MGPFWEKILVNIDILVLRQRYFAKNIVACLRIIFHEIDEMAWERAIIHLNSIIILWYISGLENQRFKSDASGHKANQTKCEKMASSWQMSPETAP